MHRCLTPASVQVLKVSISLQSDSPRWEPSPWHQVAVLRHVRVRLQPASYEALQIKEPQRYFAHEAEAAQPAEDATLKAEPNDAAADAKQPASDSLTGAAAAKHIAAAYEVLLDHGLGAEEGGAAASNGSAQLHAPVASALAFDAAQEVVASAQEQGSFDAHGHRRNPVTGAAHPSLWL